MPTWLRAAVPNSPIFFARIRQSPPIAKNPPRWTRTRPAPLASARRRYILSSMTTKPSQQRLVFSRQPPALQRPDNEVRQVGGQRKLRCWRPLAGAIKNAVPDAETWPNVRITKAIMRGVAKDDRLDRLRLAGSKTRFGPDGRRKRWAMPTLRGWSRSTNRRCCTRNPRNGPRLSPRSTGRRAGTARSCLSPPGGCCGAAALCSGNAA